MTTIIESSWENKRLKETIATQAKRIQELEGDKDAAEAINETVLIHAKNYIDLLPKLEMLDAIKDADGALITGLKQDIAEQAAVIEKLRGLMTKHIRYASQGSGYIEEALAIPTDSKQILAEWLDKQFGEPFAFEYHGRFSFAHIHNSERWLFKKPELL